MNLKQMKEEIHQNMNIWNNAQLSNKSRTRITPFKEFYDKLGKNASSFQLKTAKALASKIIVSKSSLSFEFYLNSSLRTFLETPQKEFENKFTQTRAQEEQKSEMVIELQLRMKQMLEIIEKGTFCH